MTRAPAAPNRLRPVRRCGQSNHPHDNSAESSRPPGRTRMSSPQKRGSSGVEHGERHWIPASAGMTNRGIGGSAAVVAEQLGMSTPSYDIHQNPGPLRSRPPDPVLGRVSAATGPPSPRRLPRQPGSRSGAPEVARSAFARRRIVTARGRRGATTDGPCSSPAPVRGTGGTWIRQESRTGQRLGGINAPPSHHPSTSDDEP
jgi:hypothetical protein